MQSSYRRRVLVRFLCVVALVMALAHGASIDARRGNRQNPRNDPGTGPPPKTTVPSDGDISSNPIPSGIPRNGEPDNQTYPVTVP